MKKRVDLPEKKYEGYIFDLDGTLVDSMPLERGLRTMCSGRMNFIPAAENPPMMWCVF